MVRTLMCGVLELSVVRKLNLMVLVRMREWLEIRSEEEEFPSAFT